MRRDWLSPPFQRITGLGVAGLAYAAAALVGGNGFVAAFVAGLTLGNTAPAACDCLREFGEAEGQLLTLLVFFLFGTALLPDAFEHAGLARLAYAGTSLTLVRMIPVALSLLGSGLRPVSVAFVGWFGPRGLASILFVILVVEGTSLPHDAVLESVVAITVLASTFAHGMTAAPLATRSARAVEAGGMPAETLPVMDLPVRIQHATGSRRA